MDGRYSTLRDSYPTGTSATGGLRNPWRECRALPSGLAAALAALHLTEPEWSGIRRLSDREWKQALQYCDRSHLTLWLRRVTRDAMPDWVRERTYRDAFRNRKRLRRTEEMYRAVARRLTENGIEFLALKGLTHGALLGTSVEERVQYDIDLFSPAETVHAAERALRDLGYERLPRRRTHPPIICPS